MADKETTQADQLRGESENLKSSWGEKTHKLKQ